MNSKTELVKLVVFAILAGLALWLLMLRPKSASGLEIEVPPPLDWQARNTARMNTALRAYVATAQGGDYDTNLQRAGEATRAVVEDMDNCDSIEEFNLVNAVMQSTVAAITAHHYGGFNAETNGRIERGYRALTTLTTQYGWDI